ncbi:hypothetical protein DFH28DRAFT_970627 [Melampsora americana]|nr:hypothetical protein DFH28DRAFT_970627 [Melampsora americana]
MQALSSSAEASQLHFTLPDHPVISHPSLASIPSSSSLKLSPEHSTSSTFRDTNMMCSNQKPPTVISPQSKPTAHLVTSPQHESDPTLSKQDPESNIGSSETDDSEGSGPDYFTSDSDEEADPFFEYRLTDKQKAKRARLRAERDDIKPSYYYGEKEAEEEALRKGAGKPHLKRKGLRGVPVFEPRMDQFEDFYSYINKIDRWGMRSGIVKIIPPKEWSSQLPNLGQESLRTDGQGQMLKQARIKSPISQVIQGNRGLFRVMNVTKRKNYNALEWYDLANSAQHRPPDFIGSVEQSYSDLSPADLESSLRSTRSTRSSRRNITPVTPILCKQPASRKRKSAAPSAHDGNPACSQQPLLTLETTSIVQSNVTPDSIKPMSQVPSVEQPGDFDHTVSRPGPDLADTSISSSLEVPVKSKAPKQPKRPGPLPPSDEEWAKFVTCYDKLPYGARQSDYTVKACQIIEQEYWRTIGNGGEPMYGADTTGSLFDERTKHWNVANLDNLLNRLKLKKKIPGVTTPYLYFGAWRATFAWHVEDADLYSINYIHFGAPKFWYSIPQEHNDRFESFMASSFAKERFACPQFLRHKAFLASPSILNQCGIQLNKVVHLPGEIILTYPYGYHSGFNLGYNCAESVNFANEQWIEKGRVAKSCKCIDDAVTINVDAWLREHDELVQRNLETDRKNLEKIERVEQKRKRLSEPKSTVAKKSKQPADPEKAIKKQKLTLLSKLPLPPKKSKTISNAETAPRKLLKSKAPAKKVLPCALCPDQSEEGLLRIIEDPLPSTLAVPAQGSLSAQDANFIQPKPPGEPLVPNQASTTDSIISIPPPNTTNVSTVPCQPNIGALPAKSITTTKPKPIRRAHRVCCLFTPSTWIEQLPTGEEVAMGVGQIEKARWALKCQLCNEKMGAKVQCTKSQKCAKACHVTCGMKTGHFFLDAQLVHGGQAYSILDPPSTGYPPDLDQQQDPQLVVLCKQHNPQYQRAEAERKSNELAEKIAAFHPGQSIKVKTSKGVYQVFFHSRDPEKRSLRVTFEDGNASDMPYAKVYFDPKPRESSKESKPRQDGKVTKKSKLSDGSTANARPPKKCKISPAVVMNSAINPELYAQPAYYQPSSVTFEHDLLHRSQFDPQVMSQVASASSSRSRIINRLDLPLGNCSTSVGSLNLFDDDKLRLLANLSTAHIEPILTHQSNTPNDLIDPRFHT